MSGFIAVDRSIWKHAIFAPAPMTEREAFIWMIARAAWSDTTHLIGANLAEIKRGSFAATLREMQSAFMWASDKKVRNYMKKLENHGIIAVQTLGESRSKKTHITICNYDEYQSSGRTKDEQGTHERRTKDAVKNNITNKQENNKKEDTNVSLSYDACNRPDKFDEFWERYPRKVKKPDAKRAYENALKKHRHDDIMFGLSKHLPALEAKDTQYRPHPATWLNAEQFNDEPEQPNHNAGQQRLGNQTNGQRIDASIANAANLFGIE